MSEVPSVRNLFVHKSKTKHWYKKRLARLRRKEAKKNPEEAGTQNRSYIGGWAD